MLKDECERCPCVGNGFCCIENGEPNPEKCELNRILDDLAKADYTVKIGETKMSENKKSICENCINTQCQMQSGIYREMCVNYIPGDEFLNNFFEYLAEKVAVLYRDRLWRDELCQNALQ